MPATAAPDAPGPPAARTNISMPSLAARSASAHPARSARSICSGVIASLVSAERGDLENEFIEISEDEANRLMEELRARWTGAGSG